MFRLFLDLKNTLAGGLYWCKLYSSLVKKQAGGQLAACLLHFSFITYLSL